MDAQQLKKSVYTYWNAKPCGTEHTIHVPGTPAYFNAIEHARYTIEPEIFAFAQFTRFHKKQVLEVGVGAGSDFIQWVRAGAYAHGIDLTHEAIAHTRKRLEFEGLQAVDLRRADAECLPYPDNCFDVSYSWGVIHHSPDMERCLAELVRVTRPGGMIKVMVYNRYSLFAFYQYIRSALLKGKPFQSLSRVLYYNQESVGTKAYTMTYMRRLLRQQGLEDITITAPVTNHDLLYYKNSMFRMGAYIAAALLGWRRVGWFMMIEARKKEV